MENEFENKLYEERKKTKQLIKKIKNKTNYKKIKKELEKIKEIAKINKTKLKKAKIKQLETELQKIEFILNPYIVKENQLDTYISIWLGFLKKELLCEEGNDKCLHCNKKEKYQKDKLGILNLKNKLYSSGKIKYCESCFEERQNHLLQMQNLENEFEKYKNQKILKIRR